jgi:phage baseplate assembly protein gpV
LEKDYNELEETGKKTSTDYTAESIKDEVTVDGEGLVQEKTAEKKTIQVGDTKITIDGSQVTIETSGNVTFKVGGSTIKEEDGTVTVETDTVNIKSSTANIEGDTVKVKGSNVEITGGNLKVKGASATDLNGPFNAIKVCPFSGAPHCGSQVSGT